LPNPTISKSRFAFSVESLDAFAEVIEALGIAIHDHLVINRKSPASLGTPGYYKPLSLDIRRQPIEVPRRSR
jgi:hypothetical protein